MLNRINLKVLIIDSDFYAAQAINGYLAWDRRTRVVEMVNEVDGAYKFINEIARAELPDVILLEAELLPSAEALRDTIGTLRQAVPHGAVICLAHRPATE